MVMEVINQKLGMIQTPPGEKTNSLPLLRLQNNQMK